VTGLVTSHFVGFKPLLAENADLATRLRVHWTPTLLVLDSQGCEHHRSVGFLPRDEMQAELTLGLAKSAFHRGRHDEAIRHASAIVESQPRTHAAAEALYWRGVAHYRKGGAVEPLLSDWRQILASHPQSPWATRVSFIPH
jgi:hypothetical protein